MIDHFNRQLVREKAEIAEIGDLKELDAHQILDSYTHLNLEGLKRESKLVKSSLFNNLFKSLFNNLFKEFICNFI